MALPIWEYLRRRTCEAMLAGFQDALEFLERQDQAQQIHSAAQSIKRRIQEFDEVLRPGNRSEQPPPPALQDQRPTPPASVPANSQNAPARPQNAATPNGARRGPGRPRKEVHG